MTEAAPHYRGAVLLIMNSGSSLLILYAKGNKLLFF